MDNLNYTKEDMVALADLLDSKYMILADIIRGYIEDGHLNNGLYGSIGSALLISTLQDFYPTALQTMKAPEEEMPLYINVGGVESIVAAWRLKL